MAAADKASPRCRTEPGCGRNPQRGRAAMRELSSRTRHGLVPDFMMWICLGRDPVKQYLLELKCAHLSPTWYAPKPWRLQEEAQEIVRIERSDLRI